MNTNSSKTEVLTQKTAMTLTSTQTLSNNVRLRSQVLLEVLLMRSWSRRSTLLWIHGTMVSGVLSLNALLSLKGLSQAQLLRVKLALLKRQGLVCGTVLIIATLGLNTIVLLVTQSKIQQTISPLILASHARLEKSVMTQ